MPLPTALASVIEQASRVLTDAEPEVSEVITQVLQDDHVQVITGQQVVGVREDREGRRVLALRSSDGADLPSVVISCSRDRRSTRCKCSQI